MPTIRATKGLLLYREEELHQVVNKAHGAGYQLAIHAIGDHAIDLALDAIEEAQKETPREDCRHRIEHASIISLSQIERMSRMAAIASVQPAFVTSDFWAMGRVGKSRKSWVYPFKTLLKNVIVSAGSDCPVEHLDPLEGIWAGVTRGGFLPAERLRVDQVLRMYTVNGAHTSFEENEKGSIAEGKLADMVVLSGDPFKVSPDKLKSIRVEVTIVGGRIVKPS